MIIGLTGKYCAGKNYIGAILEKKGIPVLDVDKLGYKALDLEKETIFAQFGIDLKLPDGSIDRRSLGKKVFGNPKKLAALEAIVHPAANRLTEEWILENQKKDAHHQIINAALLHKSSVFNKLDKIIIVKAHLFTRLLRAKKRDNLPWSAIFKRFSSQNDFDSYYHPKNLPVNETGKNAEIYIVENSKSGKSDLSISKQIDTFLEGLE